MIEVYKTMNSLGKVSPSYLLICISELEQAKIDISKGSLVSVYLTTPVIGLEDSILAYFIN